MKKLLFTLFILIGTIFSNGQTSTFDISNDGWMLQGDPTSTTPFHHTSGGNPNGYCYYADQGAGLFVYWVAPSNYLGNKSNSFGNYLMVDLKQNLLTAQDTLKGDVILQGGGITIYFNYTATINNGNPDTVWTHFEIPLWDTVTTGHWDRNSFNSGTPVTNTDFQTILANLTSLKIRGEFSHDLDTGSIDNVILEPGTTDITEFNDDNPTFNIYPNPASSNLFVEYKKGERITITNKLGEIIIDKAFTVKTNGIEIFNISPFASGVYFLRVGDQIRKLVKY